MSELCLLFTIYCVARARQSSMMRESAIEREPKVGWSTLQSWDSRSQHVFFDGVEESHAKPSLRHLVGLSLVKLGVIASHTKHHARRFVAFFPNGCCLLGCPYNLSRHWVSIKISDQNVYRYVITLNGQFFWCNYLFLMVAELYSGTTGDAISMPWCIHNRYTTWVFIEWAKPFFGAMSLVFEGTMRGDFGFISF